MRLIVRYCLPGGDINTQVIEIDSNAQVDELQGMIAHRFNLPKDSQSLRLKEDGIPLVLIPDWPLSEYDIEDKCIVYVQPVAGYEEDISYATPMRTQNMGMMGMFEQIDKIDEDNEGDSPEQPAMAKKLDVAPTNFTNEAFSDGGFGSDEDSFGKKHESSSFPKFSNKLKEERRRLIKEIKANRLNEVQNILRALEDTDLDKEDTSSASSRTQVKKLINGKGQSGWNALQWAVYLGHIDIVRELLRLGADVNLETKDGWTPLQLAIYKNYFDLAELILKRTDVNINQVSEKGTALHVAAKNGKLDLVSLLLDNGADLRIPNKQGLVPYKQASIEPIRRMIEFAEIKRSGETFFPPKPPIVKGFMFKKGNYLLLMNKRYFVMDPNQGTFIRYRAKEDFPNKPKEIIPLKEVSGVRRMKAGVLYDKNFSYFQIMYRKREILACLNDDTANQWVTYIIQGAIYASYLESQSQPAIEDPAVESLNLKVESQNSNNKQTEEIELEDKFVKTNIQPGDIPNPDKESFVMEKPPIEVLEPLPEVNNSVEESKMDISQRRETFDGYDGQSFNAPESMVGLDDDEPEDAVCFQSFEIIKILGSGAFGKVYKVKKKSNGKIYAMKALRKRNLILKNHLKYAITEANVLKRANNPFLLGLHYAFQTPLHLYLVLDYCPGRDLAAHLTQKGTFTEDETRFFIAELVIAIEYLHSLNVIYRDLKPENILLNQDGHIKLADFGLSKEEIGDEDFARSFCGSPAYLSPEMLKSRAVSKTADIYGIGTVMYELLSGKSPYYSDDIPSMYHNIKKAKLQMPKGISDKAKNLITKLLSRDPNKRPTFKGKADIKKDPFFTGINWEKLQKKQVAPPKLQEIVDDDMEVPTSEVLFYDSDYSERNKYTNRVKNFSFVRRGLD